MLVESGTETGSPKAPTLDGEAKAGEAIDAASLQELLSRDAATVVDLAMSRDYLAGHIPGAWYAIRTRLDRALKKIPLRGALVLTSEDGILANLAAAEAKALIELPCASSPAAMPRGRQQAIRYPRMPGWPTKRSINGESRMSGPAIPKLR